MPLLNNRGEWEKWKKEHTGKKISRRDKLPEPYVSGEEPIKFPCWLIPIYCSPDYGFGHYLCSFIYQDENRQWDLQTYEDDEGWG
jgi:hypothetical protein